MHRAILLLLLILTAASCASRQAPVPTISKTAIVPPVRVVTSPRIEIPSAKEESRQLREAISKGDPLETGLAADAIVVRIAEIETAARIAVQAKDALELELIATREQIPAIQEAARADIKAAQESRDLSTRNEATAIAQATTLAKENSLLKRWRLWGPVALVLAILISIFALLRR